MATNILKIFNKITNSWESVSGLGADPSSSTGTVDLTNYYKKNETYSKNEIDTKVASAGNFDARQYYPKTEVYSKSETDSKIPDTYDKNQIDNKLNDYASKSLLLKYFDFDKEKYSFQYEYILKRKEKNTLEIKLPQFIENYDLRNNFVFFKLFSKDYKYGSRILNGYVPITIDGKQYMAMLGENTSRGVIFPYGEEIFENKKYTEYLYTLLVAENTEITKPEGEEGYKLKYHHKKIVRAKIEQTNVFNKNDRTITVRIELKNLEEYTKDYNYPEDEIPNYHNENLKIDFKGLDKRAFRKIEEDPDFTIDTYNTVSGLETYFAIVPNDVKEIFETKNKKSKDSYIFKKCFKLNLENSTGVKISQFFNKETTLVEDENNAKLSDVLRKYNNPSSFGIDENCFEVTTTSNFDTNYIIENQEFSNGSFIFWIQNNNDSSIRILKMVQSYNSGFSLDNNQYPNKANFEIDFEIFVTNSLDYQDSGYMYHFIDTNENNFNTVSKDNYDIDLYPKVVLKSFYVGRYITKETEEENKINSLIDSKITTSGSFNPSQYYNKTEVDTKVNAIPTFNSNLYYPKTDVYNKTDVNALLHDYAKKSELPDFTRYYEKSQIDYAFVKKSEISSLQNQVSTNAAKLVDTYTKTETYNKSEVDSKIAASGTFDASQYYNKSEAYNKSEIDTKIAKYYTKTETDNKYALFTDLNRYPTTNVADMKYATKVELQNISSILQTFALKSDVYGKSFIDTQLRNKPNYGEVYTRREIDNKLSTLGSFNASLYYPKTEVYSKSETDAKIPNLSEYVKNNYTATDLQLNTNVKIKGTLQKDNSEVGDPDEDYITSKYFAENFPVFFDQKINTIAAGSVDNFVLKNQKYTSPAYTFTEKTNEVSLVITDNFKQFNNFVITFTDTPNKLVLSGPQIGQSGVIKVINAKKINGYDSNLKSTFTLPVLDKLNDTEYFSYYVFSESEILFSRI